MGSLRRSSRASSGFTLIEMTVVLAVIVTLAFILTPPIAAFINDSRVARARIDCQTIASAIVQFYKDNNLFPQWTAAVNGGPGVLQNRLTLLVSPGRLPAEQTPTLWTTGATDELSNQLMVNGPGYTLKTPASQYGWNGPYLSSELGSDPWGNRYMVNVGLIDVSQGPKGVGGAIKNAVWVVSSGTNGTIETVYVQNILKATLGGDDIGIRIQ